MFSLTTGYVSVCADGIVGIGVESNIWLYSYMKTVFIRSLTRLRLGAGAKGERPAPKMDGLREYRLQGEQVTECSAS